MCQEIQSTYFTWHLDVTLFLHGFQCLMAPPQVFFLVKTAHRVLGNMFLFLSMICRRFGAFEGDQTSRLEYIYVVQCLRIVKVTLVSKIPHVRRYQKLVTKYPWVATSFVASLSLWSLCQASVERHSVRRGVLLGSVWELQNLSQGLKRQGVTRDHRPQKRVGGYKGNLEKKN